PVHLLTSILFFNGKVKTFETPLVEARQLNAPERKAAVFQFDVPLAQLTPGFYTCQVNVIDDAGGTFSFPRLPILIREKPAPPTQRGSAGNSNQPSKYRRLRQGPQASYSRHPEASRRS